MSQRGGGGGSIGSPILAHYVWSDIFRWLDVQGANEMVEQEFMLSDILHGEDEEEEEEEALTGEYNWTLEGCQICYSRIPLIWSPGD